VRLWLAAWLVLLLPSCTKDEDCQGEERVLLDIAGTCASGDTQFELVRQGCTLSVVYTRAGHLAIPTHGAIDQEQHPIRQGGWQLYGEVCPAADPGCAAGEFRRCVAQRQRDSIDLVCFGNDTAEVCRGTLTE
jgi:hypothetical protein